MATTADYLNKLVIQKNTLADNLVEKGVDATHEETLETLVPKVLEIEGGGAGQQLGIYPIGTDGRPTGDVIVPEGLGLTALSPWIFQRNNTITSVQLPEGITRIYQYAFEDCYNLKAVSLPSSLTRIDGGTFVECANLTNITYPEQITTIPAGDFRSSGIESVTITTSATDITIGSRAFYEADYFTTLYLPDTVQNITLADEAFYKCTSLKDETANAILSKTVSIGSSYVFGRCTALTDITTPFCNTRMFYYCTSLSVIYVRDCLSSGFSGDYVFCGCSALQTITYGDDAKNKLTEIGNYYCQYCSNLQSFTIPDNVTAVGSYAFRECTSMKYLFIPSGIVSIPLNAINTCTALENIELGQDWNISVTFSFTTALTVDSIVAMFESLKDLTDDTAKTLTLGETNLAKLTDEQKAIAINKNWTLA